jgi:hypothetical protein
MDSALNDLAQLKPLQKPFLLTAILASINANQNVNAEEAQLFRAIADTLNCPIPLLYSDWKYNNEFNFFWLMRLF